MNALIALFLIGAASACTCLTRPFCLQTMDAVNLVRAVVTSSNTTAFTTIYSLNITGVIKGSSITSLKTSSSPGLCGLRLLNGTEYLIATDSDGNANTCGPTRPWASLTPDELHIVSQNGLCDACAQTKCSKFQHCKIADDNTSYCADFCAEGRCKRDETCKLTPVQCVRAPCPDVAICELCEKTCSLVYKPVCGSDDNTYGNECTLRNAICSDPNLKMAHGGECKPKCNEICHEIYAPVCGSNGKSYGNDCELENAICEDPELKKAHNGECKPDCSRFCPEIYKPVCASDGKTFTNECFLDIAICLDPTLTKANDGEC